MHLHQNQWPKNLAILLSIGLSCYGLYRVGVVIDGPRRLALEQGRKAIADAELQGAQLRGERPAPERLPGLAGDDPRVAVLPLEPVIPAQLPRELEAVTFGHVTCSRLTVRDPDGGPSIQCRAGRDYAGVWVSAGSVFATLYAKDGHAWVGVQDSHNREFGANWALAVDRQWGCLLQLNEGGHITQFKLEEVREALKRAEAEKVLERIPKPLPRQPD
jgi:hypothetical protein